MKASDKYDLINRMEAAIKAESIRKIEHLIAEIPENFKYDRNGTMLHMAAHFAKPKAMAFLAPLASDINVQDYKGATPLHIAAGTADLTSVQLLLELSADVDALDTYGETPLHKVAHGTNKHPLRVEIAAELFARSTDPNSKNLSDQTPLHIAAQSGNRGLVLSLLANGADPTIAAAGQIGTAEKTAVDAGHKEIATLVREAANA